MKNELLLGGDEQRSRSAADARKNYGSIIMLPQSSPSKITAAGQPLLTSTKLGHQMRGSSQDSSSSEVSFVYSYLTSFLGIKETSSPDMMPPDSSYWERFRNFLCESSQPPPPPQQQTVGDVGDVGDGPNKRQKESNTRETPEWITKQLKQLEDALKERRREGLSEPLRDAISWIAPGTTAATDSAWNDDDPETQGDKMDHGYSLKLSCLRAEGYQIPQAAQRYLNCVHLQQRLFGTHSFGGQQPWISRYQVHLWITRASQDAALWHSDRIQFLPVRDSVGRVVVCLQYSADFPLFVWMRVMYLVVWMISFQDHETQHHGITVVFYDPQVWEEGMGHWIHELCQFLQQEGFFPIQISHIHLCVWDDDGKSSEEKMATNLLSAPSSSSTSSLHIHKGTTHVECHYNLLQTGIPVSFLPVDMEGRWLCSIHQQKPNSALRDEPSPDNTATRIQIQIQIPALRDVLILFSVKSSLKDNSSKHHRQNLKRWSNYVKRNPGNLQFRRMKEDARRSISFQESSPSNERTMKTTQLQTAAKRIRKKLQTDQIRLWKWQGDPGVAMAISTSLLLGTYSCWNWKELDNKQDVQEYILQQLLEAQGA